MADARVAILGAWAVQGEAWDLVLVEVAHSGNMCPRRLVLLRVAGSGLARTSEFAECLGRVEDVAVVPGRVTVAVHDPDVAVARRLFTFDGSSFTVVAVPADTSEPAGAGAAVTRWLGRPLHEILEDAGERARFGRIMTMAELDELRRRVDVGSSASERIGDWIVGTGCMAHQCNSTRGLWAIHVGTGRPAAAFFDPGRERWFGVDLDAARSGPLAAVAESVRVR